MKNKEKVKVPTLFLRKLRRGGNIGFTKAWFEYLSQLITLK